MSTVSSRLGGSTRRIVETQSAGSHSALAWEGWQPAQWAATAIASWRGRTREGEKGSVGVALGAAVGALLGAEDGSSRGVVGDVTRVDGTNALALVEA